MKDVQFLVSMSCANGEPFPLTKKMNKKNERNSGVHLERTQGTLRVIVGSHERVSKLDRYTLCLFCFAVSGRLFF